MLLDNTQMYHVDTAFGDVATSLEVDHGCKEPGAGQEIHIFCSAVGAVAAGDITVTLNSSPTPAQGTAREELVRTVTVAEINDGGTRITLPVRCQRYTEVVIAGAPSAGVFQSGVIMDFQSNR